MNFMDISIIIIYFLYTLRKQITLSTVFTFGADMI